MAKEKKESGFMHWYESYQGKKVVGVVYSVGASVVIVGALFKILHWPGASQVLMLGMFTEAFLFIIGALDKPHPEFHWEEVFPQLLGYGTDPAILESHASQARPTLLGAGVVGGQAALVEAAPQNVSASNAGEVSAVPAFDGKDVEALKASIANMSKSANSIADLSKLAEGSNKLSDKLAAAADAADKFAGAQTGVANAAGKLGANYEETARLSETLRSDAEAAAKSQAAAAKNLADLNAAYAENLKAVQSNIAEAQRMAEANMAATKSGEAFAQAQAQLAKQLADLNKVYGNMLNALA